MSPIQTRPSYLDLRIFTGTVSVALKSSQFSDCRPGSLGNVADEGDVVAFDNYAADVASDVLFHVDFGRLVQHHVHELVEALLKLHEMPRLDPQASWC